MSTQQKKKMMEMGEERKHTFKYRKKISNVITIWVKLLSKRDWRVDTVILVIMKIIQM